MQNTSRYFILPQWHHFPDIGEAWHKADAFFRLNPDYKIIDQQLLGPYAVIHHKSNI